MAPPKPGPGLMDLDEARAQLQTIYIGRTMEFVDATESTQDDVRRRAETGAAEGLVIVAGRQTAGRGRQGHTWFSPPRTGLYVSILLRPLMESLPLLPLALGLSAAEAVERTASRRPTLKWPNDIYLDGGKLGGIIAESQIQDDSVAFVVAGIGINLDSPLLGWPGELEKAAVSLGGRARKADLLPELLNAVERNHEHLKAGRDAQVLEAYRALCLDRAGRPITVHSAEGRQRMATAIDVAEDGSLLVEYSDGSREHIYGEMVSLRDRDAQPEGSPIL